MQERSPGSVAMHCALFVLGATVVFVPVLVMRPVWGVFSTLVQAGVTVLLAAALQWPGLDRVGARDLTRSLFAASVSLTGASLVDVDQLGVPVHTAWGLALAKAIEATILVGIALACLRAMNVAWADLYLTPGRWGLGLVVGLILFGGMVVVGAGRPGGEAMLPTLVEHAPYVAGFVFANAFMEEVLFRGLFLKGLSANVGSLLAVTTSSLVFALAHLQVSYASPDELVGFMIVVFVLGVLWAGLMLWTRSVLASVLFHAGADIVMIGDIFRSFDV